MVFSLISKLFGPRYFMGQCNACDTNFNVSELRNLFKKLVAQQPITTMLCWYSIFSRALKINRTGESFFPLLTYQWPSDSKHNLQEKSCCRCFNATTDHSSLLSTCSALRTLKPSLIFILQSVNICPVYYEWPDWVFIHCVQAPILYIHSRAQMTASNILTFLKSD